MRNNLPIAALAALAYVDTPGVMADDRPIPDAGITSVTAVIIPNHASYKYRIIKTSAATAPMLPLAAREDALFRQR